MHCGVAEVGVRLKAGQSSGDPPSFCPNWGHIVAIVDSWSVERRLWLDDLLSVGIKSLLCYDPFSVEFLLGRKI